MFGDVWFQAGHKFRSPNVSFFLNYIFWSSLSLDGFVGTSNICISAWNKRVPCASWWDVRDPDNMSISGNGYGLVDVCPAIHLQTCLTQPLFLSRPEKQSGTWGNTLVLEGGEVWLGLRVSTLQLCLEWKKKHLSLQSHSSNHITICKCTVKKKHVWRLDWCSLCGWLHNISTLNKHHFQTHKIIFSVKIK